MVLPCLFTGLLAAAAVWDIRHLRIPNVIPGVLIALFAFAWMSGMFRPVAPHLLAFLIAGVLGAVLFFRGIWGGGDAKLLAGIALYLEPRELLHFLLITTLAGGLIAIIALVHQRFARSRADHNEKRAGKIPYGVALVAAGLTSSVSVWGAP